MSDRNEVRYATATIDVTITDGHAPVEVRHFCISDMYYEEISFMEQLIDLKLAEIEEARAGFHRELRKKAEADASSTATAREERTQTLA